MPSGNIIDLPARQQTRTYPRLHLTITFIYDVTIANTIRHQLTAYTIHLKTTIQKSRPTFHSHQVLNPPLQASKALYFLHPTHKCLQITANPKKVGIINAVTSGASDTSPPNHLPTPPIPSQRTHAGTRFFPTRRARRREHRGALIQPYGIDDQRVVAGPDLACACIHSIEIFRTQPGSLKKS